MFLKRHKAYTHTHTHTRAHTHTQLIKARHTRDLRVLASALCVPRKALIYLLYSVLSTYARHPLGSTSARARVI
jgi:hypothetical protein